MRTFSYQIVEDGVELNLIETAKKFFKTGKKVIDVSEWDSDAPLSLIKAVGLLRAISDEDLLNCRELDSGDGYFISFLLIAKLSENEIRRLNLPHAFPYRINISAKNGLGTPKFQVSWRATHDNKPLYFKKNGSLITYGSETYRLPLQFLQIIDLIDEFNDLEKAGFEEQTAFAAELKSLLPYDATEQLYVDGQISKIQIRHAAAFSLKITGEKNTMNFSPILFSKTAKEIATNSNDLIEEDEQLLSSNEERNFSAAFKNANTVNATYLLGPANYVFLDRSLRPALEVVKKASQFSKNERIEFTKSPHRFLKDAMIEAIDNNDDIEKEKLSQNIEQLFIETRQYSDRVTDMGFWVEPTLPWLKSESNDWRSDSYAFYIQGETISIPQSDIVDTVKQVENAIATGQDSILLDGKNIKPELDFLNLLESLLTKKPDDPYNNDPDPNKPKSKKNDGLYVLNTKENFDTVNYNKLYNPRSNPITFQLPECLSPQTTLKEHQHLGVSWLVDAYNRGFPGVLMADDMGLGKTLQALTFLAILTEFGILGKEGPILVVAPVGLLKNWEEEHNRHFTAPGLGEFIKLYGNNLKSCKTNNAKGRDIYFGEEALNPKKLKRANWILTTYETLRDYQASLGKIRFSCVVFDELQKAKNPRSLISHSTTVLNRDFAIGLTGTPVENSLADLWTIMDILSPGRLKDLRTFMKSYPEPKKEDRDKDLDNLHFLARVLLEPAPNGPAPVIRRMKLDLPDTFLPKKSIIPTGETTRLMPDIQNSAYTDISNKLNSGQTSMIEALHSFRSISLHPINPKQVDEFSVDDYIAASARLTVTFSILDQIKNRDEKALLFVESRAMQPVLASIIKQKYHLNSQPMIINGMVSGEARQEKVNKFQALEDGFDVMIISPKAGGVGLTLTAANNVIHVERWWNPAVEDQCTDRAYRIGQTKAVNVYLPISRHSSFGEKSFDCILDRLLDDKRSLAKGLFIPTTIANDELGNAFRDGFKPRELSLEEIDCFENGKDFEAFIQSTLRRFGLKVELTQTSYDYGADLIVEYSKSGKTAIIQCKHRSSASKSVSEGAANDVLRAIDHYDLISPSLFVVTNAGTATKECRNKCESEGIILLLREDILNVGPKIKEALSV